MYWIYWINAKQTRQWFNMEVKVALLCLTLWPHGLYSLWNDSGQNTEVVAFPFSRGSFQPRNWPQASRTVVGFFTSWATSEAQEYWSGWPIPSPVDLPHSGIEVGSPALQADSLPTELLGRATMEMVVSKYSFVHLLYWNAFRCFSWLLGNSSLFAPPYSLSQEADCSVKCSHAL